MKFSDHFSNIVICYKQSACLAANPITVDHFAYLFNYTPVGRGTDYDGSDSKTIHRGPVVQSVVSLTSLLRVISLTVLADSIYNILIFFC